MRQEAGYILVEVRRQQATIHVLCLCNISMANILFRWSKIVFIRL